MTTYRVTLSDGQKFVMSADFVQAASSISVNFHDPDNDDEWQASPYQVADARHDPKQAAELLAEHYATGDDDCTDVDDVTALDECDAQ